MIQIEEAQKNLDIDLYFNEYSKYYRFYKYKKV